MTKNHLIRLSVAAAVLWMSVVAFAAPASSQECESAPSDAPPPNVVGFPLADAESALRDWYELVEIVHAPVPGDGVDTDLVIVRTQTEPIWICPDSGSDDVSDPSYPQITLGLGTVVPDVVGETLAAARDMVRAQGLEPVEPANVDDDREVEAQDPRGGETVDLGTDVILDVAPLGGAEPPPAGRVEVPLIVELTFEAARDAVQGAGLVFIPVFEGDGEEVGRVIGQRPAAGTLVRRGRRVTATIEMVALGALTGDESSSDIPWFPLLVALAIVILLAIMTTALVKGRHRRRRTSERVAFRSHPGPLRVLVAEDVDGGRSFSFSLRSRVDTGRQALDEEVEVTT